MQSLLDLSLVEVNAALASMGEPAYRARQIWQWIYLRGARRFGEMSSLPAPLREKLHGLFSIERLKVGQKRASADGTIKWLLELQDAEAIEAVLIPEEARRTLCVSSQVGCAFGCAFCRTGLMGFRRHLSAGEILAQILTVVADAGDQDREVSKGFEGLNLVFMGMGEPTDNWDAVRRAILSLGEKEGLGLSPRRITVSTVGGIPAMESLADMKVNLALSVNAVHDDLRSQLMPVNKKYPLADLMMAARRFREKSTARLTFEYVLLRGINDSDQEARTLGEMAGQVGARVNLIPFNASPDLPFERPTDEELTRFSLGVTRAGVKALVRKSRGRDVMAACGQLATLKESSHVVMGSSNQGRVGNRTP